MRKMLGLVLVKIRRPKLRVVGDLSVAIVPMQKLRNIRARRQRNPDSGTAVVFGIVEQEPLAHFASRIAHNGISIGVVSWRALKNLHA
jgi:hypothetical protein